ncbi:transposase [Cucumis melo var. makuwa]|nr:transposase [Cucumis melo var. makuwa]
MDIDMTRVTRRGPRIPILLGVPRGTEDQSYVPTGAHVARVRERARDWRTRQGQRQTGERPEVTVASLRDFLFPLILVLTLCDWVDNRSGIEVDELGFTIVDLKRIGHKSDSFILATQEKQVFYVQESSNPEWSMVLTSPQRTIEEYFFEDEIGDMLQECGYRFIQRMPNVDTPNEIDDTTSTYIKHDRDSRWIHRWRIAMRMKEKCF